MCTLHMPTPCSRSSSRKASGKRAVGWSRGSPDGVYLATDHIERRAGALAGPLLFSSYRRRRATTTTTLTMMSCCPDHLDDPPPRRLPDRIRSFCSFYVTNLNDVFMVKKGGLTARNERVKLRFSEGEGPHVLACTCGFPARYKIPCCHALAVCRGEMTTGFFLSSVVVEAA